MNGTYNSFQLLLFAIVIIIVILINYFIFALLKKKRGSSEMDALLKTTRSLSHPFAREEQDLNTLSELISGLKTPHENRED